MKELLFPTLALDVSIKFQKGKNRAGKLICIFFFKIVVDEELFEDNPIEYIRRDLEGSG